MISVLVVLSPWDDLQQFLISEVRKDTSVSVDTCVGVSCSDWLFDRVKLRLGAALHQNLWILSKSFRSIDLEKYDCIFVNETLCASNIIESILKRTSRCKIFYVMWNTIDRRKTKFYDMKGDFLHVVGLQEGGRVKVISFDMGDCKRYGLQFNGQVVPYFGDEKYSLVNKESCFFCGLDKGRIPILKKLESIFDANKITYKYLIAPDAHKEYRDDDQKYLNLSAHIPYQQLVREIRCHKVIVDIVQGEQDGITWRPVEAIFYEKKLITNFQHIKEYDFYHPSNVFILGVDDETRLREFVEKPYHSIENSIIQKYRVHDWMQRLL